MTSWKFITEKRQNSVVLIHCLEKRCGSRKYPISETSLLGYASIPIADVVTGMGISWKLRSPTSIILEGAESGKRDRKFPTKISSTTSAGSSLQATSASGSAAAQNPEVPGFWDGTTETESSPSQHDQLSFLSSFSVRYVIISGGVTPLSSEIHHCLNCNTHSNRYMTYSNQQDSNHSKW